LWEESRRGFDRRRLRGDVVRADELHHAPSVHTAELPQDLLGVRQQGAWKEANPTYSLKPCTMTMYFPSTM
jgi:hypothetical protein